jgi:hypothetical protein
MVTSPFSLIHYSYLRPWLDYLQYTYDLLLLSMPSKMLQKSLIRAPEMPLPRVFWIAITCIYCRSVSYGPENDERNNDNVSMACSRESHSLTLSLSRPRSLSDPCCRRFTSLETVSCARWALSFRRLSFKGSKTH